MTSEWPEGSKELVKQLHEKLRIDNKDWHRFKGDKNKRSAELIIAALSQLINGGDSLDIEKLLIQAKKWVNSEIKDPGCPRHKTN